MQRCIECGLGLRSIEMLSKRLCSSVCEANRIKRLELPRLRAELQCSTKKKKGSALKKMNRKLELKLKHEERKKRSMLERLHARDKLDPFFQRQDWRILRYQALKVYGRKCALCKQTEGRMHVDHIKPRSLYPQLALIFDNLQILCEDCNLGKLNLDETDFRHA